MKNSINGIKIYITLLSIMLAVMFAAGVSFAWLRYIRQLNTVSLVQVPSKITISGANRREMQKISLELTADDIQQGDTVTINRVFCIESTADFLLEVAHTTNIRNMDIKIYPVLADNSNKPDFAEGWVKGTDGINIFYYKPDASPLTGGYINKNSSDIASQKGEANTLHDKIYDSGDNVQKNAEPLYWKSDERQECDLENNYCFEGESADGTKIYYRYYVLQLSWKISDGETDMVYLLAAHSGISE